MPGTPSAGKRSGTISALVRVTVVAAGLLGYAWPALADVMPPERRAAWNPGIPGGVPARTTVCATVNASTYGNGTTDATAGIQAAINACPVGQVVQLSAGDFLINGPQPILIGKGIVLRGAGPSATRLRKTSTVANPLVLIGERSPVEAASVNLTASAPKDATSVQVASSAGFSVGQLVLLDELTDNSYVYWGVDPSVAPGAAGRGWFTRYDRPVGQMLEIASITGNTISFTTPLHIAFDLGYTAQLTRYTVPYGARYAGLEDLYVRGGQDDNVTLRFALYSWVKNVESDWSTGDSFGLDSCLRCVLRDSYAHDTPNPNPGGTGYLLSIARYTADSLVENSIFMNGNKVMVMRASGGGNVVGYNYFDDGFIGSDLGWVETGLNASHMACPHFELFEGNQAFNIDGDDTWGGAVYNTFFRNHATGKRRSYADIDNRRAIGLMYGHYYYSFVGNVLGTPDEDPAPYTSFAAEDFWPWKSDPIGLWRLGYTPLDWTAAPEARVVSTTHRHGNFEFASGSVEWESGYDQTLPSSLYLTGKPAFFGTNPWPWVDPTGATKLYTLPARARYDAGHPTDKGTDPISMDPPIPDSLTCPATVAPGAAFTTTVSQGTSAKDWVASFLPAAPNSTWVGTWKYVPLPRPAMLTMTAPAALGTYELRLLANDTFTLIGSCTYQVGSGPPLPSLSINDVTVSEGNTGTVGATFSVTLSPAATGTVTVSFATANGTATAGSDYVANSGTLTFNPGDTVKTVTVLVNGDTTPEANETFFVNLSAPSGATISDSQGQGTITNDDASSGSLTCPVTVAPSAAFTTTVSGGVSAKDWVASYLPAAPNSTWVGTWKYAPLPRPATVAMTAPAALGTYELRLLANDTFTLIGSCTYQVGSGPPLPSLSINDVTVTEGNTGTVGATFSVTLSPAATGTVTVSFATANGTATAGSDYVANSGTLTFNPGDTVKTVTVLVNGDTTPEADETFFVDLSAPSGATISDTHGQGTITNDDASSGSLTCPVTVAPSAAFTTTVSGGVSAKDWVASYTPGSPNSPWLGAWKYVPLPRPATVTLTAPSTAGPYEVRLLANDTFTVIGACSYQVAGSGDTTPPQISGVGASGVNATAATVSWSTDEPADTQVDYGTTTAYGSSTTLNPTLAVSHSQALSGLSTVTLYHYRVKSRDAAGNLATSADFTFTTLDGAPPSVSITAPAGGAIISGAVTVSASATDNVAVVGVQFKLDGVNLGAEDTTSPYSVSWSTTTAIDGSHALTAIARDAAGNATTSATVNVTVANAGVLTLAPQDTYIGLDATAHSTGAQLNTYTWPDNKVANAILMKFDLSALPAGAVVVDASLQLALVSSDATADSMYTVTAHKVVGKDPVIATATGYTDDGVIAWTPNTCCSNNVPLAQADISVAYDTRAIDKTPGYKAWSVTGLVQEWVANPTTNSGLLLNSDVSKLSDRYRFFASAESADPTLRPFLRITYSLSPDVTPPAISGVAASAITTSGAAVNWTTNEASDSQVEYGTTTGYGSLTALNGSLVASHAATLGGLSANTLYHYRVRSRDVAGNLALSGDFTFTTLAGDLTAPTVAITAPAAGATVSGPVTVAANASDNVGVVGVQFKLDGVNLGAEDTTSPYSVSWNTTGATNGSHALTAVARDAAGNVTTSAGISVTVSNDTTPPSVSITAPAAASTVSGTVAVSANASDNVAVVGVQFKLDGANLGTEDTASPYSVSWNTTGATNGSHTLTAVARDAAGNVTTSPGISVTVSNDTTPPSVSITAPAAASTVSGTVAVSANASDNVAVVGVQFKLDGGNLGAEDTTSPYSVSWDTTGVANGSHTLTAVARDAAGNVATAASVSVLVSNGSGPLTLTPQDTFIKLDATNQSANTQLLTYTWPDNKPANAILMKFDLTSIPPTAVVTDATLRLALIEADTAPETTYTVTAHKLVGRNPVITAATGFTADGVTAWTANSCCDAGVPLADADISAAYDSRAIDKALGYKSWSVTAMVQEWVASAPTNFGLLLHADTSKLADRYRSFASMENPDTTIRPYLTITYSLTPDVTPPAISAVLASGITTSTAAITWTTNEPSDSQVEYGTTTGYGSLTTLDGNRVVAHAATLSGLAANTLYHFRVRSKDFAGNLALSPDATLTTLALDVTPPAVSLTAPLAGATVVGTTTLTATASDNVGVVGVQFRLDGANLGAEDTTLPYSYSWNSTTAANGSHSLTAVARDAAGNRTTSATVSVTVNNPVSLAWPNEPSGFTVTQETGWESGTLESWYRMFTSTDKPITVTGISDSLIGESKTLEIGYLQGHVGGGGTELRYDIPAALQASEIFVGYYVQVNSQWQGHSSAINKMVYLDDFSAGFSAMWYEMFGSGSSPLGLYVVNQSGNSPPGFHENVTPVTFTRGVWHKVEIYQKQGTPNNGVVRVWVDGILATDRSDVVTRANPVENVTISGIWGGVGDSKLQFDYMRFDRIRISRPGSGTPDTTPPAVALSAPAAGAVVSGASVTMSATASDDIGVAGVQFRLDGANLGAEDTTAPYSISWDTTTATSGAHSLTAVARDAAGNQTTSNAVTVTVSNGTASILFQEGFEDANLGARGWYDNTTSLLSTAEHVTGSVRSIEYKFLAGATGPTAGAALRRTFPATDSVYLSYYVKYSTNWVGSQKPYHPHEFHFLTNRDDVWSGLSSTHLTTYIEQNGGTPLLGIQDGENVDQGNIGVNLTAVTENRGVAGCNGSSDGYADNCYVLGGKYVNEKKWYATSQYFRDAAGPFYKNDWHFVEAYFKLNTISGGKGVNDGVAQYWFDGQLVIDRRDVLLRTGANATMQFNQFVIAPYIGDGSPVTQSLWVDNLTVATGHP